ncbi:hypothetical protein ELY21_00865 [Legionella sp. km535]|uniref:hypothetical protein n=1 Tax=Legionella sp. km535 TaxID=2498107 RepID=UPI000F8E177C|nr:hypothetical protein [Legionella sp. km535]RUR20668.1 hypothetical protein ELY21_00865 [Legionella sp. km535]
MAGKLSISFLTGSDHVIQNRLNSDIVIPRKRRTVDQMFFQPYESKEEFVFCARHTFLPIAMIGLAILDPAVLITTPAVIGAIIIGSAVLSGIHELVGDEHNASYFFNVAKHIFNDLCQAVLDLVVLPLSLLVMTTRGASTGLHAAVASTERDETPAPGL